MLDNIFLKLLDMSLTGSIVILVVMAARLLLKRAPKVIAYALWAVVLLRLLCPFTLEAPVSLLPQREPVAQSYQLSQEPISVAGAGVAAYQVVGDDLNGGLGAQHVPTTRQDAQGNTEYVVTDWWNVVLLFGQYLWIAGVAGMLLHGGISYLRLRRKLRVVLPLEDGVFLADDIPTPFVVGIFHPKIYLPSGLSQQERMWILLHERQHICRGDPAIKLLAYLALCLHWFNPLVWLAFSLAGKDMEMSCDEAVIRKQGDAIRGDYAACLLRLATGRPRFAGTPLAFGEGDPKGRIRNLAKWKKPVLWLSVVAAVGCVILGICLLTDPPAENPSSPSGGTPTEPVSFQEDRVAEGTYKATSCVYMNPLSSYYPGDVYNDFTYTVTADGFTIDGILMETAQMQQAVFGWQKLEAVREEIAFLAKTEYAQLLLHDDFRYQNLGDRYWMIRTADTLYLVKGGEKEALCFIFTLAPVQPEIPQESVPMEQGQKLTLADVLRLSQLERPLVWEDLAPYRYEDVGSGLHICLYEIDAGYTLWVSGGSMTGEPFQVHLSCTANESSVDIRTGDVAAFIQRNKIAVQEALINDIILSHYRSQMPDGLLRVESHVALASETAISTPLFGIGHRAELETVYLLVNVGTYSVFGDAPQAVGGSTFPAAITFGIDEVGQYTLQEYWEPRDGSDHASDVRKKFPGEAAENALNIQQYTQQLQQACDEQARAWLAANMPLRETIERQFLLLASQPEVLENPEQYLKTHQVYGELLNYGTDTLRYCFSRFSPSSQPGGTPELMALVCEGVLERLGEQDFPKVAGHESGNAWFNHFTEYALLLAQEEKPENIPKYHPGAWLLLQMRGEMS